MVITGAGVSGVSDVGNHVSLSHCVAFGQTICVMREVGVIKNEFLIGAELIDRSAAAFALEELQNFAVSGGENGRFRGRGDVDRIVRTAFRSRIREGVEQLFGTDTGDGDD